MTFLNIFQIYFIKFNIHFFNLLLAFFISFSTKITFRDAQKHPQSKTMKFISIQNEKDHMNLIKLNTEDNQIYETIEQDFYVRFLLL